MWKLFFENARPSSCGKMSVTDQCVCIGLCLQSVFLSTLESMAQETYDIGLTHIFLQYISEIDVFEYIRGIAFFAAVGNEEEDWIVTSSILRF